MQVLLLMRVLLLLHIQYIVASAELEQLEVNGRPTRQSNKLDVVAEFGLTEYDQVGDVHGTGYGDEVLESVFFGDFKGGGREGLQDFAEVHNQFACVLVDYAALDDHRVRC